MRARLVVVVAAVAGLLLASTTVGAAGSAAGPQVAARAQAALTLGPEIRVSGVKATSNDRQADVAYNATDDEFLVVWTDRRNGATSGDDIYGQRFDGLGNRLGWNIRISRSASGESDPAVTYSSRRNEYLVVWQDDRDQADRGIDVYGQLLDTDGRRRGGEHRISGGAALGWQLRPDVGHDRINDRYLVVWQDGRNLHTRADDVYGQLLAGDLGRIGWNFRLSGTAAIESEWAPAVAHNPVEDQWLVVWSDYRDARTRGPDIYGQRLTGDAGRLGPYNFRISGPEATAWEGFPDVAYNPLDNQYLVVWHDDRDEATRDTDVYGQRLDDIGRGLGANFRISGAKATAYDAGASVAHVRSANQYLVVWIDRRRAARGLDIYGQRIAANGDRLGWNKRISGWRATASEFDPAVAHGSRQGTSLVVWDDGRDEPARSSDIYGRLVG